MSIKRSATPPSSERSEAPPPGSGQSAQRRFVPIGSGESSLDVRPARAVRLIEHNGVVVAYPEPHLTPVLPGAWTPLTREEQDAVLNACDMAPEALVLRLGSQWEPGGEYRVYQLSGEWSGLFVASRFGPHEDPAGQRAPIPRNRQLLALGRDAFHAVSIALNFFNWDLETNGHPWRLSVDKDGRAQL
jgi:hypothetical protein